MTDDKTRYLHEQLINAQGKYAYFLLAAAAAAIALALKLTETAALRWLQLPLGFALVCWALSFYFGCRYLLWVQATLRANIALLQVARGDHPDLPPNPHYWQVAAEGVRSAADANAEAANRRGKWQFRLLIAGAVLFIAWHVLEMAARTQRVAALIPVALL